MREWAKPEIAELDIMFTQNPGHGNGHGQNNPNKGPGNNNGHKNPGDITPPIWGPGCPGDIIQGS